MHIVFHGGLNRELIVSFHRNYRHSQIFFAIYEEYNTDDGEENTSQI
jgi:hypothetical protein